MNPEDEPAAYPVGAYSRFLVRYPAVIMAISFIASGGLSFLAIQNNAFETLFGWSDLSSVIVQRLHGFDLAQLEWYIYLEDHGHYEVPDEPETDRRRRLSPASPSSRNRKPRRTSSLERQLSLSSDADFFSHTADHTLKPASVDTTSSSSHGRALLDNNEWVPPSCARQTVSAEGSGTYLVFEDKSNSPLSPSTLASLRKAQEAVAKLSDYKAICLLRYGDKDGEEAECSTTLSPVNWAAWLQPLTPENMGQINKYDNDSVPAAQCLEIPQDVYQLNRDKECKKQYEKPVTCSLSQGLPSFPDTSADSIAASPFKAMCKTGPGQQNGDMDDECSEQLRTMRDFMFAKNWDCNSLETKYSRIALQSAGPLDDSGSCDAWNYEDEMEEHLTAMIDPLFEIKQDVEKGNSDITMYFTNNAITDYYLQKDLRLLGLSVFLVVIVLWVYTSSLFLTFAGLFEILISFPLGLFVWSVVLNEPGVTVIMYNGIFIILGIGCDDIFVFMDAFRQAQEQPPHISGSLETRFAWSFNRAALAMLTTSVTTCLAFGACAVSQVWDIRCFGIVNGFMVLFDFLLVITWFPACVVFHEKHIKRNCCPSASPQSLFKACRSKLCCKPKPSSSSENEENEEEEDAQTKGRHWLEEFYGGPYADFVINHRKGIVGFFLFLGVVSTYGWVMYLKPSTKPFSFFDEHHFVTKTSNVMLNKFANVESEGMLSVGLGFGVDPKKPWNQGGVHPAELNNDLYENTPQSANYVSGFDLFDHQQGFSRACQAFHSEMVELGESGAKHYFCWIDDFQVWLSTTNRNGSFPFTDRSQFVEAVNEWVDDKECCDEDGNGVKTYTHSYTGRNSFAWETYEESYQDHTGYAFDSKSGGDIMNFAFCGFITGLEILDDGYPNSRMWKLHDHMQTSLEAAEKAGNMEGLAIQVVDEYDFMALGSYLAYSAFMSMLASLAIAVAVIFLLTRNLRLSLLASVCLYCIVSFVFGLMVVSGWSINLLEAVDISIAGGMSVDYLLHMVHSYNHNSGSSAERVRKALREMGVSVSMGIATTFIACCALLLTDMLWFRLFGVFIIMVVCSAFLTSMFGLMALLAQVGPSNRDASVEDEGGGNNENGNDGKGTATGEDKGGLEASGDSQPATMSDLEMIDMKRSESKENGGTDRSGGKDKRVSVL